MKIIAQQDNKIFLVLTKDSKDPIKRKGVIVDTIQKVIFYPEQLIMSMIKFGYWEEYKGSQDKLKEFRGYGKR